MTTLKEIIKHVENEYPQFTKKEVLAYADGYFDGQIDSIKDMLKTTKEGLSENNRSKR